jgi:serine/threonine-protein kinase
LTQPHPSLAQELRDRYRLERELGRGGMATVYLAHDLKHKRSVALKVLHPELAATLGPQRFEREIEIAARLQHPHILSVHDSGETAGYLWFTMPFVEGESLRDRLRREVQLPVDEAVRIASEAARALDYAHRHEVIHRDIKPENILVTTDGDTLVADFGIARALGGAGPGAPGSPVQARLTETGTSIGTPAYMSPEQASGDKHVDARSDVYSLAIVLYEMLAGEPPFTGPTAQAVIAKRFAGPAPRVRTARPSVPESVDQAVARALEPTPADRFATAADFAKALAGSSTSAAPPAAPTAALPAVREIRRRVPLAAITLGLGFIVGLGLLFAWRSTRPKGEDGSGKVVAVMPFENMGDSADAYFADGLANDLRTKLSQVAGLTVIARGSSNEYRHSTKSAQEVARELGTDYLITATVQWEKEPGRPHRVRVTPELVDVRPGHAPQTRWGGQFDAEMTGVFQVQGDISLQVVQALDLALGDSAKHQLARIPTQSVPAYDAFLRGEAAFQQYSEVKRREAVIAYEQAVALDSNFIEAWAQLGRTRAMLYDDGPPVATDAVAARRAAEKAVALAPRRPEGHRALAAYYTWVQHDHGRALTEDSLALVLGPPNAELLADVGADEGELGRWEPARRHLTEAIRLDPRSFIAPAVLGQLLLETRNYAEAEKLVSQAIQLAPSALSVDKRLALLQRLTMVALAQGDLVRAREIVKKAPRQINPASLVAYFANNWDLYWMLDEPQQQLLLRLTPSAFEDDRGYWAIVLAQTYAFRGNHDKARIYADSARQAFEQHLKIAPDDADARVFLGLAFGYLGKEEDAVREGERGGALTKTSHSGGAYQQHQLVRIYMLLGEQEKALDRLEPLLKIPYHLSPGWLRVDPNFESLRGNPRFQRLTAAMPVRLGA